MTIPATPRRRRTATEDVFAWLTAAGFTGLGVPISLGGTGGGREEALGEVMRLQQTDPEAAAALASHQCVIGALLAGRNVGLRDDRIPELARGDRSGIWPSTAVDDMLHRGTAAVQAIEAEGGRTLSGPVGRVKFGGRQPIALLCPVQWSVTDPPGLALLDGERSGWRFMALSVSGNGAPDIQLVSLDEVRFRADDLIDADGARIAMVAELQALHSTVRSWLERNTGPNPGRTGSRLRDRR